MADGTDRFWGLEGFREFLWKWFGLLLTRDFLMLGFFLHGVLLETFDDNTFGHEGGDFVFKIGLTLIRDRVHFLNAFLG